MTREIEKYRQEIDRIDQDIITLLEERYECVAKIGEYKKAYGLPVRDAEREKFLLEKLASLTELDPEFIKELYSVIFNHSYKIEE